MRTFTPCDIVAEHCANEHWGVNRETGEVDYSDLIADGGGANFDQYYCIDHGFGSTEWAEMLKHEEQAKENFEKASQIRKNMPGYLWGETLMPYLTDEDVLRATELKDELARIHNSAVDRKKRNFKVEE